MKQALSFLWEIIEKYGWSKYLILVLVLLLIKQCIHIKRLNERRNGDVRARYVRKHHGFLNLYWCSYCLRPVHRKNMEVDHIYPFVDHGSNQLWNLTSACHRCNDKKKAKKGLWVIRGYLGKIFFENLHIILLAWILIQFTYPWLITTPFYSWILTKIQ